MQNLTSKLINKHNKQVEEAFSEYLYEVHKITLKDIESFVSRFHNVKFKCFSRTTYTSNKTEHYYYKDICFMSVEHTRLNNIIYKHWRDK